MDAKFATQSFKVKVIQEYEVYIYYQQGVIADSKEEIVELVLAEATDLAFNEEGLVAKLHEETNTENGYIAYVRSFDPVSKILYNTTEVPNIIKVELENRGLVNGKE
jgi:hypothetical protein